VLGAVSLAVGNKPGWAVASLLCGFYLLALAARSLAAYLRIRSD
jgi:hypothetical protein